ncbi:uncharacterized protein LOC142330497 isoform X2 [Lycorma delicatula]|uniref:uncharacterized protein LOC142330497 isoform X2 n=1 Tax=Lycorma delicatula TaxID=130591 RepID=UPI003F510BD2
MNIKWMNFILQLFFPQIFAFDWQKIMDVFKEHNFNGTMPKGGKTEVTNMFNKVQEVLKDDPELWTWIHKKAEQLKEKKKSPFDFGFDLFKEYLDFMKNNNVKGVIIENPEYKETTVQRTHEDLNPDFVIMYGKAKLNNEVETKKSESHELKSKIKINNRYHENKTDYQQQTEMHTENHAKEYNKYKVEPHDYNGYYQNHPGHTLQPVYYRNEYAGTGYHQERNDYSKNNVPKKVSNQGLGTHNNEGQDYTNHQTQNKDDNYATQNDNNNNGHEFKPHGQQNNDGFVHPTKVVVTKPKTTNTIFGYVWNLIKFIFF